MSKNVNKKVELVPEDLGKSIFFKANPEAPFADPLDALDDQEGGPQIVSTPVYANIKPMKTAVPSGTKRPAKHFYINDSCRTHIPEFSEVSNGEISKEDMESIKKNIVISETDSVTMVVGLVCDISDDSKNQIISLRCVGGQPLGGYIYDNAQDCYLVRGVMAFDLGKFGFALKATIPGAGEWSQKIPVPASVLENHFSPAQRRIVEDNRKQYPSNKYEISYIQMVS